MNRKEADGVKDVKRLAAGLLAIFFITVALSGCSAVGLDVENKLRPPKGTGEQEAIQQALETYIRKYVDNSGSYLLKYPQSGEHRSAFLVDDFDGDGQRELGVIAPFHGDCVRIYKKQNGRFQKVYEYGRKLPFCHAFYGGTLCGKPTLVVGHRAGARDFLAFTYDSETGSYQAEWIDHGRGPANTLHYQLHGKDVLVATNRETDEVALYELEP